MDDKSIIVSVLFKDLGESAATKCVLELKAFAKQSGGKVVSSATKTACLSMSLKTFEKLFDRSPHINNEQPPGECDFGTPEGYSSAELPIPKELLDYVELLIVEPPALRVSGPARLGPTTSVSPGADCHGKKKKVDAETCKQKDTETKG